MKHILLSFLGNNDPFNDQKQPGPILSVIRHGNYSHLYILFSHEKYLPAAVELKNFCHIYYPDLQVEFQAACVSDPISYELVYPAMYEAVKLIINLNTDARYTICVSSGTPVMHTCWILLQRGGVIPAKLIQINRQGKILPLDLKLDDFPELNQPDLIKTRLTRMQRENSQLKSDILIYDPLTGNSEFMKNLKQQIAQAAHHELPVILLGETGTGKELVAEAIHFNSSRNKNNFVPVNCGAVPENLFESCFFGHKKGAFTGAVADQEGYFLRADQGTIFLDEIGELPLAMQSKLLRVLENHSFYAVGDTKERTVNIRIIVATNRELGRMVQERKFREDLYYRLQGDTITLQPLNQHIEDAITIAEKQIGVLNQTNRKRKVLSPQARKLLLEHSWPGNVRELLNVVEAAYTRTQDAILPEHLKIQNPLHKEFNIALPPGVIDLERDILPRYYRAALERCGGNATKAARVLGLAPATFRARLRKLDPNNYQ